MVSLQGQTLSPQMLAGKTVLFDFWATWCGPCHDALPSLRNLAGEFRKKPFVLISVAVDSPRADWRRQIQRDRMSWPQVFDASDAFSNLFHVKSFPTFILLDGDQIVRGTSDGWDSDMRQALAAAIYRTIKLTRRETPAHLKVPQR